MALLLPPPDGGLTTDDLEHAEAVVAAALGTASLEAHEVSQSGTVGPSGLIPLKDGPCTALGVLTLHGAPAAGILSTPWTVDVSALLGRHGSFWTERYGLAHDYATPSTAPYALTYTAGFTADNLPPILKRAILAVARTLALSSERAGVKSESMGPVSRTYADLTTVSAVTPDVAALLRPWRQVLV